MKKPFILALIVVMSLTLAACGTGIESEEATDTSTPTESVVTEDPTETPDEPVVLVDVVSQGISLKLPSGMTEQGENFYADTTTGDSATFAVDMADESWPLSDVSQDDFIGYQLFDRSNVVVTSFDNAVVLNGNKGLICKFSFTSEEGNAITGAIITVTYKGAEYTVSLLYSSDNAEGALASSMDDIINSIAPVAY
ncbi:MAG: hypothetical protein WCY62_03880 [Clostridia bacterium]|jgi:hypothetical protein